MDHQIQKVCSLGYKITIVFLFVSCSLDNPKRRYILADRLFIEKKFEAAVSEFERVSLLDTVGDVGSTALYRAAIIQTDYLNKNNKAIENLKRYLERQPKGPYSEEARQLMARILFEKLGRYDEAAKIYDDLALNTVNPKRKPEFLYKKARSMFLSQRFEESRDLFLHIHNQYPKTPWGQRAYFDYGLSILTIGQSGSLDKKQSREQIQNSVKIFLDFLNKYPKSGIEHEVRFELAGAYAELEEWDKSIEEYEKILNTYPSKTTVMLKMTRLKERRMQKEATRSRLR
jgi:TolA-binding protein